VGASRWRQEVRVVDKVSIVTPHRPLRRLSVEKDTKMVNTATFIIRKEDHTVGNLLRMYDDLLVKHNDIYSHSLSPHRCSQLLRDDNVIFSGYKMPHPLEQDVHVKVQCKEASAPIDAVYDSINDLATEFEQLKQRFDKAVTKFRDDQQRGR
jgi:DNA-directed RNA polymerase II subunit RPB11